MTCLFERQAIFDAGKVLATLDLVANVSGLVSIRTDHRVWNDPGSPPCEHGKDLVGKANDLGSVSSAVVNPALIVDAPLSSTSMDCMVGGSEGAVTTFPFHPVLQHTPTRCDVRRLLVP
jgi:hypothetical protein